MNNLQLSEHWNSKYANIKPEKLGWYEEIPIQSLKLILDCPIDKNDQIIDVGCGTSTLPNELLKYGYTNIVLTDISSVAIDIMKKQLDNKSNYITFFVDDITKSEYIKNLKDVAIWHDRAVLHFLTDEKDQDAYIQLLKSVVKKGGYVIISTFAVGGLNMCSGIPVKQYDIDTLSNFLGSEFKLCESIDYMHITSWNQQRPHIYGKFMRL